MLFVPGDSERKLGGVAHIPADALILDLEDSVAESRKPQARALVAEYLAGERIPGRSLWIRINPLDTGEAAVDLETLVPLRPDGIVLPKIRSPAELVRLSRQLDKLERDAGITKPVVRLLPIATETPSSVLALGTYSRSSLRLAALTWGVEDLGVALGAETTVDEHGEWLPTYQLVRSLCLLGAADAGVPAIDGVYTSFRDTDGFRRQAQAAKRDGFAGKLAINPAQVAIANAVFVPRADEVEQARRIVAAFEVSPDTGVVALNGRMFDRPHLMRAQRVLEMARQAEQLSGAGAHSSPEDV